MLLLLLILRSLVNLIVSIVTRDGSGQTSSGPEIHFRTVPGLTSKARKVMHAKQWPISEYHCKFYPYLEVPKEIIERTASKPNKNSSQLLNNMPRHKIVLFCCQLTKM